MKDTVAHDLIADSDIAIVGMAAHLPGAQSIDAYWQNLKNGIESIRQLSPEELTAAGEPAHLLNRPDYVPHAAPLDGFEMFDADFFGFSPKESAIMDPQHRQFLEVSWEALENAGHPPEKFDGPIGVFAGCGMGSYFYFNICSNPDLVQDVGMFLLRHTGNDKDFLSTRVSHVFDLRGPSINIQTACSTSLVAVHYAAQSLLNGECDMAIAGGVTIELPQNRGYLYREGEVLSPDGHCHAFDHRAQGTVFGSGAGAVVLRRLKDAIADGDHIWGVIKGSAINNDGAAKAGYLAPSVDGQAAAIAEAQAIAGITADTVDYVECHGTGTYLGDPIEVAALTAAFRETTENSGYCRIGSVKTNIGHLDTAAGVASLIKATLGLHHRQMPPTLGYEKPNPVIDFDNSPFRVNDRLTDWPSSNGPRRAGINSLGVGGTNAHVIVDEAPTRPASEVSDWPFQLITVSGRSKSALDANSAALAQHLRDHPDQPLADVAYTLQQGRRAFERRRVVVAETHEQAAELLASNDPRRAFTHTALGDTPDVVFMFPGGGAQYANMGRDLYETEPVFAEWMDRGLDILQTRLDYDIRSVWMPEPGDSDAAEQRLKRPSVQLPLIMIVEYALAQLWMSWGVQPAALVGHSMGENTAACVAGVIGFDDCIGLVHLRGQLFDTVPAGGMLSVAMSADDLKPLLGDTLDLASVNAPQLSVATGPQAALDALAQDLAKRDVECQRIPIDIAAHSRMLDPILERFGDYLRSITLHPPKVPFASNSTGQMITAEQATDPEYWVAHLRGTIHFADCIATLAETPNRVFVEVGPGKGLGSLAGQHPAVTPNAVIGSLRHPHDDVADDIYFMAMLGRMWAVGGTIDWAQIWGEARRNRVVLPTYAFQRASYFIEPGKAAMAEPAPTHLMRRDAIESWGYRPAWTPRFAECDIDTTGDLAEAEPQKWLLFQDDTGLAARVGQRLRDAGHLVIMVKPGDAYARVDDHSYIIAPERGRDSYDQLIRDLASRDRMPTRIGHFWLVTADQSHRPGSSYFHRTQEQGFYSLLFLSQALASEGSGAPLHINLFTAGAAQVRAEPLQWPEKSTVMGPARVIPREFPGTTCAVVDLALPEITRKRRNPEAPAIDRLSEQVLEDMLAPPANAIAAIRGERRYEMSFKPYDLAVPTQTAQTRDGACLITGGFGGIGLTVADTLIKQGQRRIALLSRHALPERARWDEMLRNAAPNDATAQRIRALQQLEKVGGDVLVVQGDVSNIQEMRDAVATITARFGRIASVVHAAGVIHDAPILGKSLTEIEEVFTPKIHGTRVLDTLFPDGALDWMVLFSSSSTVTAPAGQVDYVAANEYLNAFARSRQGGKTSVIAIDWGIWSGVGMAADAMAARTQTHADTPSRAAEVPMLDSITFDQHGDRMFTARFDAGDQWFLNEHRTKAGDALLPGTGYLELAAQALRAQGEVGSFAIRDLYFLQPLQVPNDAPQDIRVLLPRTDDGYALEVQTVTNAGVITHAQAALELSRLTTPDMIDLAAITARCDAPITPSPGETLHSPQEAHLAFGQRWHVLRSTALGKGEAIAHLALPDAFHDDLKQGYQLHPAMMDLATGWAMQLIAGYSPTHLWVPVSYGHVRVYAPLPAKIVSWVRSASHANTGATTASFDVTICAPDGRVLVDIEDFTIHQLATDAGFARPAPAKAIETPAERPLSPAEELLKHNLSQGIQPTEGGEAFMRALAAGQPQIVVSSLDLDDLTRQVAAAGQKATDNGQKFQRPELDSDYEEPANEIERRLAAMWQALLGVDQIGVNDSFFDLGGHSLIAVRLFAQVKKAWSVDFPISVLFEAPTIRQCAEMIAERGVSAEPGEPANPATKATHKPTRRFTHIVPMHSGEGGEKTPFFLVAGMFGNVLNLRHLAHLLGTDRPFYGLQARGLYGDQAPHDDLVIAARDYIAEIRAVQPHGPYMLGGFSGGGITALEIAQQLQAAGDQVSLLVMLDTPLPVRRTLALADRLLIQWQELREGGIGYVMRWAGNRLRWEIAKRKGTTNTAQETDHDFHNAAIEAAFMHSVLCYKLRKWAGPLVLFRPPLVGKWQVAASRLISSERAYVTHDNDWGDWAERLEVHEVPGDHDSMVLEPNVRVLAAGMKRCIETAERRGTPQFRLVKTANSRTAAE